MKKLLLTLSVLVISFLFLCLTSVVNAQSEIPEEAYKAAEIGMKDFKMTAGPKFKAYGYENENEVQETTIDWGYPVYTLNYRLLFNNKAKSVKEVAEKSNNIEFLITSKGKVKSFLYVEKNGDRYNTIGFGGNASSFNGIYNKILNNKNILNPIILKDINDYYLVYKNTAGEEMVIPVSSEAETTVIKSKVLLDSIKKRIEDYKIGQRGGSTVFETKDNQTSESYKSVFIIGFITVSILFIAFVYFRKNWKLHKC